MYSDRHSGVVIPFPSAARLSAAGRRTARPRVSLGVVPNPVERLRVASGGRDGRDIADGLLTLGVLAALALAHLALLLSALGYRVL